MTSSSRYERFPLALPQTVYPSSSMAYQKEVSSTSVCPSPGVIKSLPSKTEVATNVFNEDKERFVSKNSCTGSESWKVYSPVQSPLGSPICFPTSDIHPAFRLYPYAQFPALFDVNYLSAYCKSLTPSSSLSSMMVLPSGFISVPLPGNVSTAEKDIGLGYQKSDTVGLCNT